jgi:hypothetical protein
MYLRHAQKICERHDGQRSTLVEVVLALQPNLKRLLAQ